VEYRVVPAELANGKFDGFFLSGKLSHRPATRTLDALFSPLDGPAVLKFNSPGLCWFFSFLDVAE
jgi:hypothetical protein